MPSGVALVLGLSLSVIVQVHCQSNNVTEQNRTNDLSEEVVQLQTALRQLKEDNNNLKKKLHHALHSLTDVKKERDVYKKVLESPGLKCMVYTTDRETENSNNFINNPVHLGRAVAKLTQEIQGIKIDQEFFNASCSTVTEQLLSTRSQLKIIVVAVNEMGNDILSLGSNITHVQTSMKEEITQVQTSMKAELRQVETVTKSEILEVNTSVSSVLQEQESRLRDMENRIVQVEKLLTKVETHKCPDGFIAHEDSCYMFSTVRGTFDFAVSTCKEHGSHLAVVTSDSENDFLRSYLLERAEGSQYFLGGSDLSQEGMWTWLGGTPIVYNGWGRGEPNDDEGREDCLTMFRHLDFLWNDSFCSWSFNFICERSQQPSEM